MSNNILKDMMRSECNYKKLVIAPIMDKMTANYDGLSLCNGGQAEWQ